MSIVNQDRPSPQQIAGELGQALRHDAGDAVIAEYRRRLCTERAERAIQRALADAPPLTSDQVAYLRAIVQGYGPEVDGE